MLNQLISLFFVVTIGSIPGQVMLLLAWALFQRTRLRSIDAKVKKRLLLVGYALVWLPLVYLPIRHLMTAVASLGYVPFATADFYNLSYSPSFFLRNEWVMPLALVWFVGVFVALYRSRRQLTRFRDKVLLESSLWALDDLPIDWSQLPKPVARALASLTVVKHPAAQTPLVFGYWKRFLILPDQTLTSQELHMVLCHEMTHLLHKDLWLKLLAEITRAFFFYNPLFIRASRLLDELCEQVCDQKVTIDMGAEEKKDYGRLLLDMLEHASPASPITQVALSQNHDQVKNRLQAIIQPLTPSRPRQVLVALAAVAATLASVLVLTHLLPLAMSWDESRQLFSPSFFQAQIVETTFVTGYDDSHHVTYSDPQAVDAQGQGLSEEPTTYVLDAEDMIHPTTLSPQSIEIFD